MIQTACRCLVIGAILLPLSKGAAREAPSVPPGAFAGPVKRLTLEEAREIAMTNNKGLTLARLSIEEKQHAVSAASKDYFPKLLGSLTYFHFNEDLGRVLTVQTGRFGLLPAGTLATEVAVFNQNSSLATVFVAQPITKLIAVNAAVQVARADERAAMAQLDKVTRDLVSGVTQVYHTLLGAQRIEAALLLQVKLLEDLVAAKTSPELRIGLVEARQGLVQVRGQARELIHQLNYLLDLPACTVLELVDPLPVDLPVRCADDGVQQALAHSPEIHEAEQAIAKAQAGLKVAKMNYIPDVNIIGGYANQTAASYIQPNIGYIGVSASYTFWDWGKRREVKHQRETQIALAYQNLQVVTDKVQLETRKAFVAFEQARDSFHLAQEMVQARKDAEKEAKDAALLQAKADTSKAELEVMKAEIAFRVAHTQLSALICKE